MTNPYLDALKARQPAQTPTQPTQPTQPTDPLAPADPTAPEAPPAEPTQAPNPYVDQIRERDKKLADEADLKRRADLLAFRQQNPLLAPGEAAEAMKYAAATGLEPAYVAENLKEVREAHRGTLDWAGIVRDHPVLAEFIGDPVKAPMVLDDSATLGTVEWLTGRYSAPSPAAKGDINAMLDAQTPPAWRAAINRVLGKDLPFMLEKAKDLIYGQKGQLLSDAEWVKRQKRLDEMRAETSSEVDFGERALAARMLIGTAKMAPMLIGTAASGGAAAGGLLGRWGGMLAFQTAYTAPTMYDKLSKIDGLSEDNARLATMIGAPLVGYAGMKTAASVLGIKGEEVFAEAGVHVVNRLLGKSAQGLTEQTILRTLGEFGARWTGHTLEGALGMALQGGVEAAHEELTRSFGTGQEARPEVVAAAMLESFKQGLVDLTLLSGWGAGRALLRDVGLTQRAVDTRHRLEILSGAVEAAKYPEVTEQVAAATAAKPGSVTHTYLDRQTFVDWVQKLGRDPRGELVTLLGEERGGKLWDEAVALGAADLAIPVDLSQRLLRSKEYRELMLDEGRFALEDRSFATTMREMQRVLKLADEVSGLAIDKMDQEQRTIYDAEYKKALSTVKQAPRIGEHLHEGLADAHARMVLGSVSAFRVRTGETEPLIAWYDKTYGKQTLDFAEHKYTEGTHDPVMLGEKVWVDNQLAEVTHPGGPEGKEITVQMPDGSTRVVPRPELNYISQRQIREMRDRGEVVSFLKPDGLMDLGKISSLSLNGPGGDFVYITGTNGQSYRVPRHSVQVAEERAGNGYQFVIPEKAFRYDLLLEHLNDPKLNWAGVAYSGKPAAGADTGFHPANDTGSAGPDRQHGILLNKFADEVTLAHELSHGYSQILADLAAAPDAHPEIKKQYEELVKAMGYKDAADRATLKQSVLEERLAHAFEEFLINGKSPSLALAPVFGRFIAIGSALKARGVQFGGAHWAQRFPDLKDANGNKLAATPAQEGTPEFKAWFGESKVTDETGKPAGNKGTFDPSNPDITRSTPGGWGSAGGDGAPKALTKELEAAFARMLSATDEIKQVQQLAEAGKEFTAIKGLVSEEEWAAYQKETSDAQFRPIAILLKQITEATHRENTVFLRRELARLQRDVQAEMAKSPIFNALHFVKTGEMLNGDADVRALLTAPNGKPYRLSEQSVIDMFGKVRGQELIDSLKAVEPRLFTKDPEQMVALETFAGLLGFTKGEAGADGSTADVERMLYGMRDSLPPNEHIAREGMARLRKMYQTDLLDNPAELHKRALDSVIDEKMARKVIREMTFLARKLDPERAQRSASVKPEELAKLAKRLIASKELGAIRPEAFIRALSTNTLAARDAAKGGKYAAAWDASEQALLNIYLYREARALDTKLEKAFAKLDERATSDSWRSKLGKESQNYLRFHDALLEAVGLREPEPGSQPIGEDGLVGFINEIIQNGQEPEGWDPFVVRDLLSGVKRWRDLTPTQALNVHNAIVNIRHLAEQLHEARIGDLKVELSEARQRLIEDAKKHPFKWKASDDRALADPKRSVINAFRNIESVLASPELIVDEWGKAAAELIFEPYLKARNYRFDLEQKIKGKFNEAFDALPKEIRERLFEELPGVRRDLPNPEALNVDGPVSRAWLYMVMLNMGNASNRERLLDGRGWNADQVMKVAEEHLTPEEMDFIQKIWDLSENVVFPLLNEKEIRRTGLPLEKIEAMPFKFKGKEYRGGYFPAEYMREAGARQITLDNKALDAPVQHRMATVKPHVNERAEHYSDVINLNWSVLENHFSRIAHDIAFDEYIRGMNSLLYSRQSGELQNTMYQYLGAARKKQIHGWLAYVANKQADSIARHMQETYGVLNLGRSMLVYSAVGHRIPMMLGDLLHPMAVAAFGRTDAKEMARAAVEAATGLTFTNNEAINKWKTMRQFALDNSYDLKIRTEHSHKKLREEMLIAEKEGAAAHGKVKKSMRAVRDTSFVLLDVADQIVSTQIWTAKYREVEPKVGHDEAVAIANKTVRETMPSHLTEELPALLRDKRTIGAIVIFHGYYNKLLDISRRVMGSAVEKAAQGDYAGMLKPAAIGAGRIAAGLAVASIMGDYVMGHGKDKDETWGQWWARKSMTAPFTLVPLGVSDVGALAADKIVTGRVRSPSPRTAPVLSPILNTYQTLGRLTSSNRETHEKVFDLLEAGAFFYRLPSRQWRTTAEYLYEVAAGETHPKGVADFTGGVFYGKPKRSGARDPFRDLSKFLKEGKR